MSILSEIDDLIIESVEGGFFYHGTDLKHAKKILSEGLVPGGGDGWGTNNPHLTTDHSVFLTGKFERAARYSVKFDDPVVFGVYISTPDRISSLSVDLADEPRYGADEFFVDPSHSPLQDISYSLDKFAKKRGWGRDVFSGGKRTLKDGILPDLDHRENHEIEIKNFNLYKETSKWLQRNFDKNKADNEYKNFLRNFRPGEYGEIHLRNDGSFKFDSGFFSRQNQVEYPEVIPPSAIKEAWVSSSTLNRSGINPSELREVNADRLPGEVEDIGASIAGDVRTIGEILSDAESKSDLRELEHEVEDMLDGYIRFYDKGAKEVAEKYCGDMMEYADEMLDDPDWPGNHDEYVDDIETSVYDLSGWAEYELEEIPLKTEFGKMDPSRLSGL